MMFCRSFFKKERSSEDIFEKEQVFFSLMPPTIRILGLAVFTLVTRGHFLTSASKFSVEPNGGIFDVSLKFDRASPNVETAVV